jgi:hypothetical protein
MAEGFGRYYPAEFARYLRLANGEWAETVESLGDGVDRGHFSNEQVVPRVSEISCVGHSMRRRYAPQTEKSHT